VGKPSKRANLKQPGQCIFCGEGGLTKEHIFAEWIQQLIPPRSTRTVHTATFGGLEFKGKLHRPGDPLTKRLRIVCRNCNNVWMSGLQTQAKPLVSALIRGDWVSFDQSEQKIVASWMAMTAMVIEFADVSTIGVPRASRERFFVIKEPPLDWYIWIAPYEGESHSAFWHTGIGMSDTTDINSLAGCNVQITTFSLGKTLFHSFSNNSSLYFQPLGFGPQLGLIQIWPPQKANIVRPLYALDDAAAYRAASTIRGILLNLKKS
jgi:hypothetical protein